MITFDLTGCRFVRLVPVRHVGSGRWECLCDCGKTTVASGASIRRGYTSSCGCLRKETERRNNFKHGLCHAQEYKVWEAMKARCHNPNDRSFKNYGARGIKVVARWHTFSNFYADMGPRLDDTSTLDRINNSRGYGPANCRWTTRTEQANNKRTNRLIIIDGIEKTVAQWARQTGVRARTISRRIDVLGWNSRKAIFTPSRSWRRRNRRRLRA